MDKQKEISETNEISQFPDEEVGLGGKKDKQRQERKKSWNRAGGPWNTGLWAKTIKIKGKSYLLLQYLSAKSWV